jgi:hypothetical protein
MMLVQNLLSGHGYSLFGSSTAWARAIQMFGFGPTLSTENSLR